MSVLSDRWIKKMAIEKEMIKPFVEKQTSKKIANKKEVFSFRSILTKLNSTSTVFTILFQDAIKKTHLVMKT